MNMHGHDHCRALRVLHVRVYLLLGGASRAIAEATDKVLVLHFRAGRGGAPSQPPRTGCQPPRPSPPVPRPLPPPPPILGKRDVRIEHSLKLRHPRTCTREARDLAAIDENDERRH